MSDQLAGDVIAKFLDDQLAEEHARKASLESRGLAVITTSGTLVTLLFALSALVTKVESFTLPDPARFMLMYSVGALLVAALSGIYINAPSRSTYVDPALLTPHLSSPHWEAPERDARKAIAVFQLQCLTAAAKGNTRRARVLLVGAVGQAVAVALLGAAVISVFASH
jgi:hypothetical protein